ncbi:hypothetical protein DL93DRAFT_2111649 [Clavulina sp. PMI_390]|nr:hypothetical protein DL93DRAFT_2111649 [Clavulina sp. PMI_390]
MKLLPTVLSLLWLGSTALAINVEGSVVWDFKCTDLKALHPQTKVVLDGGRYRASIRKDGKFTFYDVAPGSYVLEVLARDHEFDPLRVDVLPELPAAPASTPAPASPSATSTPSDDDEPLFVPIPPSPKPLIEVRPAIPGTPFHAHSSAHLQALQQLPYPIAISTKGEKVYVVKKKGFDVLEMFKNPMMLMMLLAGGMVFILPTIMENMDPEMVKEMQERQGKMFSLQNSIQSGDFSALKTELLARVDGPQPAASGAGSASAAVAASPAAGSPSAGASAGGSKKANRPKKR